MTRTIASRRLTLGLLMITAVAGALVALFGIAPTANAAQAQSMMCIRPLPGWPDAGCGGTGVYVSDQPAYRGPATVIGEYPPVIACFTAPCPQPSTDVLAWQSIDLGWVWSGTGWQHKYDWKRATRAAGTQVYAWGWTADWTWTWTQSTGWLAMHSNRVLIHAAPRPTCAPGYMCVQNY